MSSRRRLYSSNVTQAWAFVAPHLVALVRAGATSEKRQDRRASQRRGRGRPNFMARRSTDLVVSRSVLVYSAAVAGNLSVPERGVRRREKPAGGGRDKEPRVDTISNLVR